MFEYVPTTQWQSLSPTAPIRPPFLAQRSTSNAIALAATGSAIGRR
jgi:hypothetical protein